MGVPEEKDRLVIMSSSVARGLASAYLWPRHRAQSEGCSSASTSQELRLPLCRGLPQGAAGTSTTGSQGVGPGGGCFEPRSVRRDSLLWSRAATLVCVTPTSLCWWESQRCWPTARRRGRHSPPGPGSLTRSACSQDDTSPPWRAQRSLELQPQKH